MQGAGRVAEVGPLTYNQMQWCDQFKQVFADFHQSKVQRVKRVVFCSSLRWELDWFLAFADMLMMESRGFHSDDVIPHMFPALLVGNVANKVTSYIKSVQKSCPGLPANASGGELPRLPMQRRYPARVAGDNAWLHLTPFPCVQPAFALARRTCSSATCSRMWR
jgi:hypothetical protein